MTDSDIKMIARARGCKSPLYPWADYGDNVTMDLYYKLFALAPALYSLGRRAY